MFYRASFFCQPDPNFPDSRSAPCQIYQWLGPGLAQKNDPHVTSTLPLIFTGIKKFEIRPPYSIAVDFEVFWFQNRATYRTSKACSGSAD